ncbi:cytochrome P450 [Streptomyces sp. NPDC051985]|uniref:cytochrome P450 n=1 Tax=Streptomyces sp. NPDC051985 TaxID=3155807 RepID=UPI0034256880
MTEITADTAEATIAGPFPWPRPRIDPPEVYGWMREERPITRVITHAGDPAWLVTRYDDVRAILSDPRVSADIQNPGLPAFVAGSKDQDFGSGALLRQDPPQHTMYRRMLSKNFLVKRVEAMRPAIQKLVDEKIDAMLASPDRSVDFVHELALPVPSTVLSWILGVREQDRDFFNKASEELLSGDPTDPESSQQFRANQEAIVGYVNELAQERAAADDPGDDILGQLVKAAKEGSITYDNVSEVGFVLTVAGHDTTASMTAMGLLTLLQHPDQLAELQANPELIPDAIEEMLRYLTVVNLIIVRVATEDIEIGGVTIPKGEGIVPLNFSANRDDAHYPDAARFDIHRKARDHFAFGYGIHQCIGQPLARVELQVIFETVLRRMPTIRLAVPFDELPFKIFSPINGVSRLPVTW